MKHIGCLLCIVWVCMAARKPYRYNLDPLRVEQLLASLVIKPRLTDNEWRAILTARLKNRRGLASSSVAEERHRVIRGESLWRISKKSLGSPWYWPRIWAANQDISNPHDIEIGRMLAYYREGEDRAVTVPLVRLVPPGRGRITHIETDTVVNGQVKSHNRPTAIILSDEESVLGEIRGSYGHGTLLYVHESIYVEPNDDVIFKEGQRLAVIRKEKSLRDGTYLGQLARVLGEIEITHVEKELSRAEIKELVGTMKRGDLLIPRLPTNNMNAGVLNPPSELEAKILQGEETQATLLGQGQIVFLNRGVDEGMQPGFKFRVLRDRDPVTKNKDDVLTEYKGEIRIIATSKNASVGLIIRNNEPILIGDLLIPAQRFSDPPPLPWRLINEMEVD